MEKVSVLVSLVAQLLHFVDQKGFDSNRLLEASGVDPQILLSPDNRISIDQYNVIQNNAVELTADDYFGLHIGELAIANSISIIGLVMMNCNTVGDAIRKAIAYQEVVGNLVHVSLENKNENTLVELSPKNGSYGHTRHCFEGSASGLVNLINSLCDNNFIVDRIWFTHEPPESISEYKRIFNCEIAFNQLKNAIFFPKKNLSLPISQANPNMLILLEKHAQEALAKVTSEKVYSNKVSDLILNKLDGDPPAIKTVAKELAVSVRKLQQKLFEEKTSFSEILKSTRINISKNHLKYNDHSISEIAFLLGFSEPGVFSKAFLKWTGYTPYEYRKRI